MEKSKLIFWKNFLFRWLIIGFVLGVILFVVTLGIWDWWSEMLFYRFQVSESRLGEMFVNSMLYMRAFILLALLAPAIALHLVIKKMQ